MSKKHKAICGFMVAVFLCLLISGCAEKPKSIQSLSGLNPPMSSKEIIGKPYEEVLAEFKKAGFSNVTTLTSDFALDASIIDANMVESATISGISSFDKVDSFSEDDPVVLYCSEKKYPVNIKIECLENLFFSKYDLNVTLAGSELGSIKHGSTGDFSLNLPEGSYVLQLSNADDAEVMGKMTLKVPNETDFVCSAWCRSSKVSLELAPNEEESQVSDTSKAPKNSDNIKSENDPLEKTSKYELAYILRGNSYDVYMLIDTDEKVVLHYTTNDTSILKGKYKGNFNDGTRVTWRGGGETWSEILHWNYVDHDTAMILVDRNGFDTKFLKCDVDGAERVKSAYHVTK